MKTKWLTFAVLGSTLLVATIVIANEVFAQESEVAVKKPQPKPAPQGLWVLSAGDPPLTPNISIFQGAQLRRPTGTVASLGIRVNPVHGVRSLTFDGDHNLWLGLCSGDYAGLLAELSVSALRRLRNSGSAKFTTTIQDPEATDQHGALYLSCPLGLQFDPSGNLWVQTDMYSAYGSSLIEYARSDLSSSGKPVPIAVIPTPGLSNVKVVMTFDHRGNLWQQGRGIVEYTAAQLAAGDPSGPYLRLISGPPDSEYGDIGCFTFDAKGNLWGAFESLAPAHTTGLKMFAAADLNGQGIVNPTPVVIIDAVTYGQKLKTMRSIESPQSLAFDNAGDLWVANGLQPRPGLGFGHIAEFTAAQLSTSGSPIPVREILSNSYNTNIGRPEYLTFGPALR